MEPLRPPEAFYKAISNLDNKMERTEETLMFIGPTVSKVEIANKETGNWYISII